MSKTDACIMVECDNCHETTEIFLTALAGGAWDERNVARKLEHEGWVTDPHDDNLHLCPSCAESGEGES